MKVLVTGAQGQLARALKEYAASRLDLDLYAVGQPQLDLAETGGIEPLIHDLRPDVVINAAAYTAVDRAEREPEMAFRINAAAAGEVANGAASIGAPIIQISTDYVFDGTATAPYSEQAPTNPINIYGRSKLAGEDAVRAVNAQHLILRTSWIFSPFGHNFVKTMLRLAEDRDEVCVVADQFGCPTSADSLALAVGCVLDRWMGGASTGLGQTYHVAGTGACTWADLAEEVFGASAEAGGPSAKVIRITTEKFPTPAPRPRYSVLASGKFAAEFGVVLPSWQSLTRRVVTRLAAGQ
ncbi:dTDP-4-dehydrorhamnose reductase [Sphingomonas lutea]|uniref:dTDP-4-dehydrorhamnose reductase n=1 Tax=Sphingomonas lutea TaxID=1045317 RepID=A0A7G9SEV3_9SPHN|nr:dTDP-4-dehydrorhamnose reductase [Sphingomonas lutea]QNN66378.1 dTDP-4-dehydrorhamnose reductase [Sphingomonas lutea]